MRITRREIARWPLGSPVPGLYALQRIAADQLGTLAAGTAPGEYLDDVIVFVRTLLATRVTHQRPALWLLTPRFRRARRRVEELYAGVRETPSPDRRFGFRVVRRRQAAA